MNDTDERIIRLYEARDEQAIAESERQYGRYCTSISENILNNKQDAEECVNDTWLKTWNSIPPARPDSLRVWFGRIVRQLSINRLHAVHAAKRDSNCTVALDELADCLPAEEETGDLTAVIRDFLYSLSAEERRLFMGRYWYFRSVQELARTYGLSGNAAALRLMRTREKLRRYLSERGYTV